MNLYLAKTLVIAGLVSCPPDSKYNIRDNVESFCSKVTFWYNPAAMSASVGW